MLLRSRNAEPIVVTGVPAPSQPKRRTRYLVMMFVRALMVPGVLVLPVSGEVQAALVVVAALTQMVAVIVANEPEFSGYHNPNAYRPPQRELPGRS